MATVSTNQFRAGLKVLLNNDPCVLTEVQFVKPGKGQAFYKVRWRNLRSGRVNEQNFRSGDTVEQADVVETEMQYLYDDGEQFHFMNRETYEQVGASPESMAEAKKWIKPEDVCTVTLFNGQPLDVTAPMFVELAITQTDPGLKGDTSSGGTKPATMETGAVVRVPLFIQEGEVIKIDTRTGEYLSRVKQ